MVVGLPRLDRLPLARVGQRHRRGRSADAVTAISDRAIGLANVFGILIVLVDLAAMPDLGRAAAARASGRTATGRTVSARSACFRWSPT